jgi:hypothetical protein
MSTSLKAAAAQNSPVRERQIPQRKKQATSEGYSVLKQSKKQ